MTISWNDANGRRITCLNWCNGLSLSDVKRYEENCDELQICYPNNLSEDIHRFYGEGLIYTELDGHWKGEAHSLQVNLLLDDNSILNNCSKTRKYEIRRARERDGLTVSFEKNLNEEQLQYFEHYYNVFAKQVGELSPLDIRKVSALNESAQFVIAKVMDRDGEDLTIHGCIIDNQQGISALHSSCSFFRENPEKRALIGRANSLLHYESILYFKRLGFRFYDFGGIYQGDKNKHYANVASFKKSFGGNIVSFQNGFVIPFSELQKIDKKLKTYYLEIEQADICLWGYSHFGKYTEEFLSKKFHKKCKWVIDNKLCLVDDHCFNDSILHEIDEKKCLVLLTVSKEHYTEIIQNKQFERYIVNNRIIGLRT